MYYDRCLRIHDFRKPTIAAVQGSCVAAGLMLAAMCDLIVAADDAVFSNPVLRLTGAGVELLVEPWELGIRKAKEFLLTGDTIDAQEAWRLGLVNRVVPRAELSRTDARAGRPDRPRAAGHGPDGQGHPQPHRDPDGQAGRPQVPLHGAPLGPQLGHRARRAGGTQGEGLHARGHGRTGPGPPGTRARERPGGRAARRHPRHRRRHADLRAVLRRAAGRARRRRDQGRAAGRGRLHAHHGPVRPRGRRARVLAVVGGRGPRPAGRHLRPAAAGRQGPLQAAGGDGGRALRELPARHHGAVGPRTRRPARRPRLRADQRVRADRPLRAPARPRPPGHRLRRAPPPHRRPGPAAGAARRDRLGLPDRRLRRLRRGGRALRTRCGRGGRARRRSGGGHGAATSSTRPCTGPSCASSSGRWPATTSWGIVRQREGNRLSHSAPLDNYPTADGFFVCIVAGSDANFARLCAAMEPARPRRTTRASPRWPSAPPAATRSTASWPSGRRASPPTRSRRAASSTTCRSGPPTARPTSSPTRTWPPAATSCRSTIRSSGRCASRHRSPA